MNSIRLARVTLPSSRSLEKRLRQARYHIVCMWLTLRDLGVVSHEKYQALTEQILNRGWNETLAKYVKGTL